ncbi:MAG: ABC transporter permease [Hyphomicrobiales bacterium]|nr:ABC transporter permease [Hyphomicrobiales bacterium]
MRRRRPSKVRARRRCGQRAASCRGRAMTARQTALVFRLAARDLRGGLRGLRILLACIAIGVAAITGVNAVAQSMLSSFAAQGRVMLGGDIAFGRSQRPLTDEERAWLASLGRVSEIATLRATAQTMAGEPAVVEIKAVDAAYPLTGAVGVTGGMSVADALKPGDGTFGALADSALTDRLGLKVGDQFRIARAVFTVRGELTAEPDRIATGIGFGPRVIVSNEGLAATGLVQNASLIRWVARVALPDGASDARTETDKAAALAHFPKSGWEARTRANVSPQLTRNVERFSQFMALIGVVSLIVGGVGVAGAVTAFVDRKRESIAIMKALGATGGLVFRVLVVEMMAIALLGAAIGAAIGAALPFVVAAVVGPVLDLPLSPRFSPAAVATGLAIGLLAALAFIVAPAGRAHDTQVASLFRLKSADATGRLRPRYALLAAACFAALVALVYALSSERKIAAMAIGAVALSAFVLRGVAWLVAFAAKNAPGRPSLVLRLALGNIRRPGSVTRPVVTSLGLGLTLLVAIAGVDGNLRRQLAQGEPGRTPDFFFIDVQSGQAAEFRKFLADRRPQDGIEEVPMLRGRIVRIGDRSADSIKAGDEAAWVLEGDRGVTFSATPPRGSTVAEGRWWPADYSGPPLVSMEGDIARALGLKVGDTVSVNVAGRIITAKIANFRRVDWRSFGINFVLVFTPSTFAGAPHSELFALTSPQGVARNDPQLVRDLAKAYPAVTALGVREALDQALALVAKLATAIRAASGVTLSTALLVLAGALAAGQRARLYDAIILRTIGATRRVLVGSYLVEFLLLGAATAIFSVLAGSVAAWAVVTRLMKLDFFWDWPGVAALATVGCLVTICLGLSATWRALGEKPARFLHEL